MIKDQLKGKLAKVLAHLDLSVDKIEFEHPAEMGHGDYATSLAMIVFGKTKHLRVEKKNIFGVEESCQMAEGIPQRWNSPLALANKIKEKWQELGLPDYVRKIEVAPPGFLNIWLKINYLSRQLTEVIKEKEKYGLSETFKAKKIMVEYAHPNTHKELHIGHMRTLIVGEALARIFAAAGAKVFRANYQGDIGPHVAKSIWGTEKILEEKGLKIDEVEGWSLPEKAHLLGEGYVKGVAEYSLNKEEIDQLNQKLYQKDPSVLRVYEQTRRWSLEYYDTFYKRFYSKFDRLFFESETADLGRKIVLKNLNKVFVKSEGAIIFDGKPHGLHKRVFLTADGNPTYEGKEMGLAYEQYQAFPFDLNVHVVGRNQAEYFKVVIKALELLDPKFVGREFHLPMGMVHLVGKKMSSRTGEIFRVDDLLGKVKSLLWPLIKKEDLSPDQMEKIAEILTIASIKYSILRVNPRQEVVFDPEKSVSLEGDSGPYLEYTYARSQSVLKKSQNQNLKLKTKGKIFDFKGFDINEEELAILRTVYKFPEIVSEAASQMAPNLICNFLYDLAQKFNLFYGKWRILGEPQENFRLALTASVGQVIKNGLNLLGIESLERM